MIDQLKKFLIVAGIAMITVSYCTQDALQKIDASTLGLGMFIVFLMFKKEGDGR